MYHNFKEIYQNNKAELRETLWGMLEELTVSTLVKEVVKLLNKYDDRKNKPDPEQVNRANHKHDDVSAVFVISSTGDQPFIIWVAAVSHKTLELALRGEPRDQIEELMLICRAIVEELKEIYVMY